MEYSSNRSEIIYSDQPEKDLDHVISRYPADKVFVVTEDKVDELWFKAGKLFQAYRKLVLPSGEESKNMENVARVWQFLSQSGADRKSMVIHVGGGMLTDLCGFASSTFKRGIRFVNVPTTLLSQVDASVGGKTGINFNGLKNEVGTFCNPEAVLISTQFLRTLDGFNLRSGFAEMIKHGLIFSPEHFDELHDVDIDQPDLAALGEIIRHSVQVKEHFVINDPKENGIRKALNFGHTIGHAIESMAMSQGRPVLHGYAVAWGMVSELFLSEKMCGFPSRYLKNTAEWIIRLYGTFYIKKQDFDTMYELMQHDKKNEKNRINFTLLKDVGQFQIDRHCDRELIFASLDYLNEFHS